MKLFPNFSRHRLIHILISLEWYHFAKTAENDPDLLSMNGGQTDDGGQIGEHIHN